MALLDWWESLKVIFTVTIVCLLFLISNKRKFFQKRNIPFVDSFFIFGSSPGTAIFRHPTSTWTEIYHKLAAHKVGGFYELLLKPMYMVRDPEYIQRILTKDFNHFSDRGFHVDIHTNPMDDNLFFIGGFKWKYIRAKLSPIFTSGRLKWMAGEMSNCADRFIEFFDKNINQNTDVDLNDIMARFSLDLIGSTVFGIESKALETRDCKFREIANKFFQPCLITGILQFFRFALPDILATLKLRTIDSETTRVFHSLIKDAFKHRVENNYTRKDMIQLLLELYQKGDISSVEYDGKRVFSESKHDCDAAKVEITEELLAAQAFIFFMAGHEGTANSMNNTLYFLSINPRIQEKLREEIRKVLKEHNGFTYESFKDMKYLEMCIMETLRLLPSVPQNTRECTMDYTFPNGVEIKKGDLVVIPTYALQRSPEYFTEPNMYYPERFENHPPPKGVYMPWGDGPKICIGKRFAELEMKMGLARIINKYRLFPSDTYCEKNAMDIQLQPNTILTYPIKKFHLKLELIDR